MERTGDTFTDIAERGHMPRQTVSALVNRPPRSLPHPDTIRRLARGLGLPPSIVKAAAIEAVADSRPVPKPSAVVLAELVETLTERDVLVLLAAARALVGNATQASA